MDIEDKQQDVIEQVWLLLEPVVETEGFELVEVEYRREAPGWVLRLFLDKPDGVTIQDCAQMSRLIGDVLDVQDMIHSPYHLEVSSPGLNRPLRKARHYRQQLGRVIEVRTLMPLGNRRNFRGILQSVGEDRIGLECDGQLVEFRLDHLERARLRYFDSIEG
ncbi:MAG TPA: ribosome maturation factor RimP [Syntrophobacteraceae bacterium]|nr:ribosome maturation factor RimP [Syntrophobacteraceae bacterium]